MLVKDTPGEGDVQEPQSEWPGLQVTPTLTATHSGAGLASTKGDGSFLISFHCLTEETEKGLGSKIKSDFVADFGFL